MYPLRLMGRSGGFLAGRGGAGLAGGLGLGQGAGLAGMLLGRCWRFFAAGRGFGLTGVGFPNEPLAPAPPNGPLPGLILPGLRGFEPLEAPAPPEP